MEHIEGLPLSDWYHAFSGVQWLLVLCVCDHKYRHDSWTAALWWVASLVLWGTIWPLSKLLKGLTLRQAVQEAWYMQIVNLVGTRTIPWAARQLTNLKARRRHHVE